MKSKNTFFLLPYLLNLTGLCTDTECRRGRAEPLPIVNQLFQDGSGQLDLEVIPEIVSILEAAHEQSGNEIPVVEEPSRFSKSGQNQFTNLEESFSGFL
jgi:hypothetical protein